MHGKGRKPQYCATGDQCDSGGGGGDGGGGDYGGGGSENYGGGGGSGGQVATIGKALKGKPCNVGQDSVPMGAVVDGQPDRPGTSGNEVNNAYYISYATGTGAGSTAGYVGDFVTTFNNEYWYQPPISVPGSTSPIFVNMGNISISPNAPMTAATWANLITQALGGPQNGGLSSSAKNAVMNYVNSQKNNIGNNGSATIEPCFDGPWDGVSQ